MNNITPAESVDTNATPEAQQAPAAPATEAAPASASAAAAPEANEAQPADEAAPAAAAAQPAKAAGAGLSPRALLKQLQQDFPAFRDCLPLSIGIDKQLLARMPGLDRKVMRAALGIHTGSMRYLRAMEKAKVRYDLDGTAGAEVPDTHRAHAKEQLQQRFKKEAERKKAERDAAAAEEANRLRQEKLQALASKFSKN
ncbi:ProQ/FINO family protein [Massilia sp.]|uniref:ProQ/FINO family protein n=1 Tax=Massilia sp. TaxID=1882437 RepID=UPI00289682B3|nr:ProQ/FINO family protein [Massilia sp.]